MRVLGSILSIAKTRKVMRGSSTWMTRLQAHALAREKKRKALEAVVAATRARVEGFARQPNV